MTEISPIAKIDKSYDLTNSRYKLTSTQTKILLSVLSLIRKTDKEFEVYKIPVTEFGFLIESDNYSVLKKECRNLMTKVLEVPQDDGGWILFNWFSKMHYKPKESIIEVRIDDDLKPYLLQMKKNFSSYHLRNIMEMKSEYSIRVYELLNQRKKFDSWTVELEELYSIFQVPKSYVKLYSNFKRKVLLVAQRELDEYSDLSFKIVENKIGKKVNSITFVIQTQKQKTEEEEKDETPSLVDDYEKEYDYETLSFFSQNPENKKLFVDGTTYYMEDIITNEKNKYEVVAKPKNIIFNHKNKQKLLETLRSYVANYKAL
jgi:plasmid replication initiation protein